MTLTSRARVADAKLGGRDAEGGGVGGVGGGGNSGGGVGFGGGAGGHGGLGGLAANVTGGCH